MNIYESYLESRGYTDYFPKKEARILFKTKGGNITDIFVANFVSPEKNIHLYQEWSFDIGNCLSDWDEWTLSDVLIKIFIFYEVSFEIKMKLLFELTKIEEWRLILLPWIYNGIINENFKNK